MPKELEEFERPQEVLSQEPSQAQMELALWSVQMILGPSYGTILFAVPLEGQSARAAVMSNVEKEYVEDILSAWLEQHRRSK